ncbi:uncharacterized protein N7515_001371 [Penicillium bovifimosum]|uniref:Uncharacterized protein n=1 Tax=Penicillium bovifimosum TaxID=126998 RepID=A0A9W9H9J9_9EURO|nr:uncharacterized protein N7515_001371 [Penicillium bovifimosum]KAJ5142584.1 hypothetical protein N7515_001371 [Penicillium bovifimosum]
MAERPNGDSTPATPSKGLTVDEMLKKYPKEDVERATSTVSPFEGVAGVLSPFGRSAIFIGRNGSTVWSLPSVRPGETENKDEQGEY